MKNASIVIFTILAQVALAFPRIIPSHANLFKQADVVIIGKFVRTDVTDIHQTIKYLDTVRVWSSFEITTILKGSPSNSIVSIAHFKQVSNPTAREAIRTTAGTQFSLISFTPTNAHYVIYLKSDGAGKYIPVTGDIDPQFSFWKLDYKRESDNEATPTSDILKVAPK